MEVTMNHIGMSREMETAFYIIMKLLGYQNREEAMLDNVLLEFTGKSGFIQHSQGVPDRLPRFADLLNSKYAKRDCFDTVIVAIAAELRYVMAVDDKGNRLKLVEDPIIKDMQRILSSVEFGKKSSYCGQLKALLRNPLVFGIDLCEYGIAEEIEQIFVDMIEGPDAVRRTLAQHI